MLPAIFPTSTYENHLWTLGHGSSLGSVLGRISKCKHSWHFSCMRLTLVTHHPWNTYSEIFSRHGDGSIFIQCLELKKLCRPSQIPHLQLRNLSSEEHKWPFQSQTPCGQATSGSRCHTHSSSLLCSMWADFIYTQIRSLWWPRHTLAEWMMRKKAAPDYWNKLKSSWR